MSELNPHEPNPNPYAPAVVEKKKILTQVEETRHLYLSHEASAKSVAVLFILGGLFGLLAGLSWISVPILNPVMPGGPNFQYVYLACGIVAVVLSAVQISVANGLRKLASWSRIPAAVLAGIGLIVFPVGTLINAYVLYLLLSKKGTMVFSPEYKNVMAQTPHIKYKTSIVVWIFLGLVVLLLLLVIFFPLIGLVGT